ncbi:MAG: flavodoxin family protein [Firmicutes bacterium]|nr:flavodoxin family protein [Bacillota bacterium]
MNLLIHDLSASEWAQAADEYKNWTVLSDTGAIRPCIGCFNCWVSGTGECIFKDGFHQMCALIHEADEMVVMSRYTYGGFSSFVKNVWDRSIGYVLPEFETAYGEMHHQKRFPQDRPVTFRFRGTNLSDQEKEKARKYVAAVCRNLRGIVKEVIFDEIESEEPAGTAVDEATQNKDIPRWTSTLFINDSLGGEGSNTDIFLKRLQRDLGSSEDIISLSVKDDPEKIAESISKASVIVLGAPLYVDGLPSSVLRFMEKVKKQNAKSECRLYALVNNGL